MNNSDIIAVQNCIGYKFKNVEYLVAAFTHSSYVNEHTAVSNERIEFLGDCVLNFLVGEKLFLDRTASEGELSSRRAALVSRAPLARIIDSLGLLRYLQVGAGVDKTAFSEKKRSDLFEAVLGAVYLDGGLGGCKAVLDNIFFGVVESEYDYKSALQRLAAADGLMVEYYTTECADGFTSAVTVGEREFVGVGKSKHLSQIDAAKSALTAMYT